MKKSPKTYEEFVAVAKKVWGPDFDVSTLAYVDSDNEIVSIIDEDDWQTCLEEIEETQKDKKIQKLTIKMTDFVESSEIYKTVHMDLEDSKVSAAPQEEVDISDYVVVDEKKTDTPVKADEETEATEKFVEDEKVQDSEQDKPDFNDLTESKFIEVHMDLDKSEIFKSAGDFKTAPMEQAEIKEEPEAENKPEEKSVFEEEGEIKEDMEEDTKP